MRIIKYFIFISILMMPLSCIDRFYLDDFISTQPKLVVNATLSDGQELQKITVSLSSSASDPKYFPFSGCNVRVFNGDGHVFEFHEADSSAGDYFCGIQKEFLSKGAKFKLYIRTPDEKEYESSYEEMQPSPEFDSLYYEIKTLGTEDKEYFLYGIQFYLDFLATSQFGKYYRYDLTETFEYHSTWPITAWLDETGMHSHSPDFSLYTCYKTTLLNDIFLLSTENFTENTYIKFPLTFVSDQTQRLMYNYSLLVKQYSLSREAYEYWETLKANNQEDGGLFNTQPATIKSNIVNINDSEEQILGFFCVCSIQSKRITLKGFPDFKFKEVPYCTPVFPEVGYPPFPRPLYLVRMVDPKHAKEEFPPKAWGYANSDCFDCTLKGGTVDKPVFFE